MAGVIWSYHFRVSSQYFVFISDREREIWIPDADHQSSVTVAPEGMVIFQRSAIQCIPSNITFVSFLYCQALSTLSIILCDPSVVLRPVSFGREERSCCSRCLRLNWFSKFWSCLWVLAKVRKIHKILEEETKNIWISTVFREFSRLNFNLRFSLFFLLRSSIFFFFFFCCCFRILSNVQNLRTRFDFRLIFPFLFFFIFFLFAQLTTQNITTQIINIDCWITNACDNLI